MIYFSKISAMLLFLVPGFFTLSMAQSGPVVSTDVDDFEKALRQDSVQLLDVRTAAEFRNGHLAGAMQANWTDKAEFMERVRHLDKERPVLVYCLGGGRSAAAARWMRENGFTRIIDLSGGFNAWRRLGKPVAGASQDPVMTAEQYFASLPDDKTVLVDVGADWCPPCVSMAPVLNSLEKDPSLSFVLFKIDAGVQTEILRALKIEPLPVFLVYKNGREVWRHQGVISREELARQLR